ncbi:hypothetical protein [Palaeococcus ferrophilus]|uniref:hypothetical protein n=1 Tax=Palaeococcus ferrophilus TaxID=83868 RepID=UPI00064FAEB9|nr:hypothetical protein [Palaeococcus ferrophilus]
MKKAYLALPIFLLVVLVLYFSLSERPCGLETTEYSFDGIKNVILSNGPIVESDDGVHIIAPDGSVKTLPRPNGTVLGNIGEFLVVESANYLEVMGEKSLFRAPKSKVLRKVLVTGVINETIPLEFGVGDEYLALLEPLDDYHVRLTFYYPESGKTLRYVLSENPRFLKLLVRGNVTVLGGYPDWNLYYFINGSRAYGTKIPVECGYEDYGGFTIWLGEKGRGYTLTSMNGTAGYFDGRGVRTVSLNPPHCFSPSERVSLTTAEGGVAIGGCLVLTVHGDEDYLGFYDVNRAVPGLVFRAPYTADLIGSGGYVLARYDSVSVLFNCTGEVERVHRPYDEIYPFRGGFLLVGYNGGTTTLTFLPSEKKFEMEGLKVIGVLNGNIVGIRGGKLLIFSPEVDGWRDST